MEMDKQRMSIIQYFGLPFWTMLASPVTHLIIGIMLGVVHFAGLRWNVSLFAADGRLVALAGLLLGRLILLSGALTLTSMQGALPLLMTALGILIARAAVMRRVRRDWA
jgi:F1F0 ATPase subunit 2